MRADIFKRFRQTCHENNFDDSVMWMGFMFTSMTKKQVAAIKGDLLERGLGDLIDEDGKLEYKGYIFK